MHDVLRSAGRPLDVQTRALFEPRFGRDFSQVRLHTDAKAAESARAVDALAYTVGHDIAFGAGQFRPATVGGRQLLAHELTHVVQQGAASRASAEEITVGPRESATEREATRIEHAAVASGSGAVASSFESTSGLTVARADPAAVTNVRTQGTTAGAGIQFSPTNVTDTRVGPVSVRGGLLSGGASRLNVIVGENLTLRTLARQLLPLWITATPFTPPGAAAPLPLDIISADELAQALLSYNQTYLPVPAMTRWRSGLRFPLPVELDDATGVATLHPLQIRALAGAFDPAWAPLLDLRASATAVQPAGALQADVAAFLTRETTALARGVHLGARALTNAVAERPFVQETFRQLGPAGFAVALELMDNVVNREVELLAAQRDGAAILAEVRTALAAAPAVVTADEQARVARANRMLARVGGVAAAAAPGATRNRADKSVTIDTVKLDGSNHNPSTDVAVANTILAQCNVRLAHGVNATASAADTTAWLGGDTDLRASPLCGSSTADERRMFQQATTKFGLTARIRAFFPATLSGVAGAGYSVPPFCATGTAASVCNMAALQNTADTGDLAHEVGHILLNSGAHPAPPSLMNPTGPPEGQTVTTPQCTTIYNNA